MLQIGNTPLHERQGVSILTRPESRMLLASLARAKTNRKSFNPHPARKPDATCSTIADEAISQEFQSSPGPKAGCYLPETLQMITDHLKFQSSPGPKAGCYLPVLTG